MSHQSVIAAAALASMALVSGCAEQDEKAVRLRAAFDTLISALQDRDAGALWNLCDEPTQIYFSTLAGDLREVRALVEEHYPSAEKEAAKEALGGDRLGRAGSGRELFIALVDSSRMAAPGDRGAREIDSVVVGAYTATVITGGGKSVEFTVSGDGSFRTGGFMEAFLKQPALITLRDNLATARKNCAEYARGKAQDSSKGDGG